MKEGDQKKALKNVGASDSAKIDPSKRMFSKAGLAAPVIMSLTSKPVFAVQGLSNMMSTHGSAICRGDDRYGGMSYTFWKSPTGNGHKTELADDATEAHPNVSSGSGAWEIAGYSYGKLDKDKDKKTGNDHDKDNKPEQWDSYIEGDSDSYFRSSPLREILNDTSVSESEKDLIAGLLNASYFEHKSEGKYIFTVAEFRDMLDHPDKYFSGDNALPYNDLAHLISANYDRRPGDCS